MSLKSHSTDSRTPLIEALNAVESIQHVCKVLVSGPCEGTQGLHINTWVCQQYKRRFFPADLGVENRLACQHHASCPLE